MSKHYGKKQPQQAPKGKIPLALFAVVGALALIVVGVIALTRPGASGTAAPGGIGTSSGPRVAVNQDKIDFGKVKMNTPVTAAFRLKNEGSEPLQILGQPKVRVVEGCWPPKAVVGSTTIQPGQETELSMTFTMHPGMDGPHDFRVDVKTNDPAHPTKELQVLSEWVN